MVLPRTASRLAMSRVPRLTSISTASPSFTTLKRQCRGSILDQLRHEPLCPSQCLTSIVAARYWTTVTLRCQISFADNAIVTIWRGDDEIQGKHASMASCTSMNASTHRSLTIDSTSAVESCSNLRHELSATRSLRKIWHAHYSPEPLPEMIFLIYTHDPERCDFALRAAALLAKENHFEVRPSARINSNISRSNVFF